MHTFWDHITITALSLEAGASFVREVLGVSPQVGGKHPLMATHNLLLRLGDTCFLEVIAPDPSVPPPVRPRWFALDRLTPDAPPSLAAWVIRTDNIHKTIARSSEPLGSVEPMSRGGFDWSITIPDDGLIPFGGAAPALIEWHTDVHPATKLEDQGVSLVGLEIFHSDPSRISRLLQSLALDAPVSISPVSATIKPYLVAHINTLKGRRLLSSRPL